MLNNLPASVIWAEAGNPGKDYYMTMTSTHLKSLTLLGVYQHGRFCQCDYIYEALYQDKNGNYFLYGEGGADTRYAEQLSSTALAPGEKMFPLSLKEAKQWVQTYCTPDKYGKVFEKQ